MDKEVTLLELPKRWVWTTVGELGIITSGGTPSTKFSQFWGGNIVWITPADLSGYKAKYINKGKRNISKLGLEYSAATLLPENTLLFSSRAPIGYCAISGGKLSTNQGFKNLTPLSSTNIDYIYYYLQSAKQLILGLASGTTFPELSLTNFSKIPIPLAPIEEQKRIVAKIEEYFSDIDNSTISLTNSLKRLALYKQLILKNAFEGLSEVRIESNDDNVLDMIKAIQKSRQSQYVLDIELYKRQIAAWQINKESKRPVRPSKPQPYIEINKKDYAELPKLPSNWKWEKIGNFSFVTKLAGFEFTEHITYQSTGEIPVIKAQNVSKTGFVEGNFSFVPEKVLLELPRIKISGGEILFVFVGAGLGNVGIVPQGKQYLLGPNVGMIKPSIEIYNKYIQYFLISPIGKSNILDLSKATAQGSISMGNIRNILIPLCPFNEQKAIVDYLEYQFTIVNHLIDTIQKNLARVNSLKANILKNAFEGKLTSQDSEDDDPSNLLAKIAMEKEEYLLEQKRLKKLKPKRKRHMAELKSIMEILTQSSNPVSAKELWQESIHKDDIEAFYAELKIIEDRIEVINEDRKSLITLIK